MNYQKVNNKGMTLPELVLAILMLTAFTSITVMVTKFTSSFFQPLNEEAKEEYISSNKVFRQVSHLIHNLGKVSLDKLPNIYKNCDVVFLPTYLEVFSATVIEDDNPEIVGATFSVTSVTFTVMF